MDVEQSPRLIPPIAPPLQLTTCQKNQLILMVVSRLRKGFSTCPERVGGKR